MGAVVVVLVLGISGRPEVGAEDVLAEVLPPGPKGVCA
jgi:hypothetical protein